LSAIAYGGNQFVAVGKNVIINSADGVNWFTTWTNDSNTTDLEGIAYGDGHFLAQGILIFDGAVSMTSADGINWTDPNFIMPQSPDNFWPILYVNGSFVFGLGYGIAYGNGLFVSDDGQEIGTSTDGTNWTYHASAFTNEEYGLQTLAYGNGKFVQVASTYDDSEDLLDGAIASSSDGTNWVTTLVTSGEPLTGVIFADGQFLAVGASDPSLMYEYIPPFYTSTDGVTWTVRPVTYPLSWPVCVAYGNGRFVAMDELGTALVSGAPFAVLELKPGTNSDSLLLSVRAPVGTACTIQRSRDLTGWQDVTNIVSSAPTNALTEISPANGPALFYRAVVHQ
jgi:hypothetical protein